MRITLNQHRRVRGTILMVALITALILGAGVASYMGLVQWLNLSVIRSQAWNSALAMAEAGAEEALAQLNHSALVYTTNLNLAANGWSASGTNYQCPTRALDAGSYSVLIVPGSVYTIYATGYVTIPALSATVARTVRVTADLKRMYQGAMVARRGADFRGFGVETDSFDSTDPNYSTGGLYDPAKRKANGDVATTDGFINVQNAKIMGTLYTGPLGTFSLGSGGSVGDLDWVLTGTRGLQPEHYRNDFNRDFPDVLPPYTAASAMQPTSATLGSTTYRYALGNGDYILESALQLRNGDTLLVTGAKARLYVTGDFVMSGSANIQIAAGASLELYVGGATASIGRVNNPGNCASFSYFGLPANRSIALSGNSVFLGTIYAPRADFVLTGGGGSSTDFQGACVVDYIRMAGHFKFHYDESLKKQGPPLAITVTSWGEI